MKVKYNETKTDRKSGLNYFFKIKNFYGSSLLWLFLAIATGFVAVTEIIYKIHIIGIGYLGIFISIIAIWLLGVKRYLEIKKFKIDEDVLYEFDFDKNIITARNKDYPIRSYYEFNDGFLVEYKKGYIFLSKIKLDNDILQKLNIGKDK